MKANATSRIDLKPISDENLLQLHKNILSEMYNREEAKKKQKGSLLLEKFGKDNVNNFKSLLRKINKFDEVAMDTVNINVPITYSVWLSPNGTFNHSAMPDFAAIKDIIEDLVGKTLEKFKKEICTDIEKYKSICKSKKLNIGKILDEIQILISEEDKMIKDIIE